MQNLNRYFYNTGTHTHVHTYSCVANSNSKYYYFTPDDPFHFVATFLWWPPCQSSHHTWRYLMLKFLHTHFCIKYAANKMHLPLVWAAAATVPAVVVVVSRGSWMGQSTQNTFKTRCELEYAQVSIKRHPPTHTLTPPHTHKIHIDSEALVKGKRIGQEVKWVVGWRTGSRVVANKKKPL